MAAANRFDVVVIGGGHNGLVTAGLLPQPGADEPQLGAQAGGAHEWRGTKVSAPEQDGGTSYPQPQPWTTMPSPQA